MEYLKVKNWEKFQHYKDRNPPWIKLHVKILNDRKFCLLPRASKCLLMLLWILASENDGTIPNDLTELKFRLRDNTIKQDEINQLIKGGFLNGCKQVIAGASKEYPETETETETDKVKKKIFKPPSLEDVILYCQEKGFDAVLANRAFEHYNIADWHDAHGKKVKNWKQKINTNWLKPENKPKPNKNSSDAFAV